MEPSYFFGKGKYVAKEAKACVKSLDDYFLLVNTTAENEFLINWYKIVSEAKLWSREWCHEQPIDESTITWKVIKEVVKERYREAMKMGGRWMFRDEER